MLNNLLLATATPTVFLGTLYPLFLDAIGGGKVSVGPPFFNATFVPLMVPLLVAMAIGPLLAWKRGDLAGRAGAAEARARRWPSSCVLARAVAAQRRRRCWRCSASALAAWLFVGALVELAERIRLFRAPLGDSAAPRRRTCRAPPGA